MGYRLNKVVSTGGLPVEYVKRFTDRFSIPVFIETGTAGGESVRIASTIFQQCHTIEIVEGRPGEGYPENVHLYQGNSPELLGDILAAHCDKSDYVFFWLDAHYSEPHESEPETVECPLLEEIQAIKSHKKAVIMIDDARLFLAPPKWPCDYTRWPPFSAVFNTLLGCYPYHYTTIIDDYIVCIPDEMKDILREEWWENMDLRFPSEEQKKRDAIKTAWSEVQSFLNNL